MERGQGGGGESLRRGHTMHKLASIRVFAGAGTQAAGARAGTRMYM